MNNKRMWMSGIVIAASVCVERIRFQCEGGKWKMIGHHTDVLPSLTK